MEIQAELPMNILVPNLGSTSLKYQLLEFPTEKVLAKGRLERIGQPGGDAADYREAIERTLDLPHAVDGVGFKAVHAGPRYRGTFRVDAGLLAALEEFEPAAPLHNGIYLAAMRTFQELRPELPLVAVVEPGFHRTLPDYASEYGVPREWAERHGVRKYGFHGASHRYVSERVPGLLGVAPEDLRLVSCHLGGSSSMCAIQSGKSVDVTMGFSPQSGLENATRHGDLDAFAVLFLMDRLGHSTARMRKELLSDGGLAGLSGIAGGDARDLEEAAGKGDARAGLALGIFAYEVRKTIGAYAAAMGGIDAVAFTGGIGENAAGLRSACCAGLEFLGIRLDAAANGPGDGDRVVSHSESRVKVVVLQTNEELIVGRETAALLGGEDPGYGR
jgi:acetate kinase